METPELQCLRILSGTLFLRYLVCCPALLCHNWRVSPSQAQYFPVSSAQYFPVSLALCRCIPFRIHHIQFHQNNILLNSGAILSLMATFTKSPEITVSLWQQLEACQILPTVQTAASLKQGIKVTSAWLFWLKELKIFFINFWFVCLNLSLIYLVIILTSGWIRRHWITQWDVPWNCWFSEAAEGLVVGVCAGYIGSGL